MSKIVLAGATGDLGFRIFSNLTKLGADVHCLVSIDSKNPRLDTLKNQCQSISYYQPDNHHSLVKALSGASVVVSAVSGLEHVILNFQTKLFRASIDAGVRRFFPSDFSVDYRYIPQGDNRNLNLREKFRIAIDNEKSISVTSILNGAFMDMLTGAAPFILYPINRILCWENPNQLLDWTSIDDTALYTAHAILEESTPRFLKISGDQVSANSLAKIMHELTGNNYKVLNAGSLNTLKTIIRITKSVSFDKNKTYPAWQGMQYMHNMYKGDCKFGELDNNRYPIHFEKIPQHIKRFLNGETRKYKLTN